MNGHPSSNPAAACPGKRLSMLGRRFIPLVMLCLVAIGTPHSAAAAIVDTNNGIALQVRLTALEGVVEITWQVSGATLATGANDFELQFFVGGGQQWQPQVSTSEPTDNGIPVVIGGVPDLFCFRMVATINGSGPILGSGTSGNEPPCAESPALLPDLVVTGATVLNTTPGINQSFLVAATVRNSGGAIAGSTTLRYFRSADPSISTSDQQLGTDFVASLSPGGASAENLVVAIPTVGTFWLGACVDSVSGESSTANNCSSGVIVSVSANTLPVAANDSYQAFAGRPLVVDSASGVLANDVDDDGDILSAALVSAPAQGSLTLNGDGSFSYLSERRFRGNVNFTYRAQDSLGSSNTATVTIVVRSSAVPAINLLLLE